MQLLSLQESVEQPTVRLSRAEAVFVSVGLHLFLLLLFLFGPRVATLLLPETIIQMLAPRPPLERPAETAIRLAQPETKTPKTPKVPLKFAYVRTPDDNLVDRNPTAPLLSDKSRRARQEVPTPPNLKQFSIDPHSQGDTVERIRPDPRLKEGRDTLEPPKPHQKGNAGTQEPEVPPSPAEQEPAKGEGPQTAERRPGGDAGNSPGAGSLIGSSAPTSASGIFPPAGQAPGAGGGPAGAAPGAGRSARVSSAARQSLQRALAGEGAESKNLFDNPSYLEPRIAVGTMSFDTQDFPWGDYMRRVKIIVENNWQNRLPLAFRNGIRGYTCVHFVIAKDGTVPTVDVVRDSGVPPFDRAATDTLRDPNLALPPLPGGFPEAQEGVSACFFYNMLPGEIRELSR